MCVCEIETHKAQERETHREAGVEIEGANSLLFSPFFVLDFLSFISEIKRRRFHLLGRKPTRPDRYGTDIGSMDRPFIGTIELR